MKIQNILLALTMVTFVGCEDVEDVVFPTSGEEIGYWSATDSSLDYMCEIDLSSGTECIIYIANPDTTLTDIYKGAYSYNSESGLITVDITDSNVEHAGEKAYLQYSIFGNRLWLSGIDGEIEYNEYMNYQVDAPESVSGIWSGEASDNSILLNIYPYDDGYDGVLTFKNATIDTLYNIYHSYDGATYTGAVAYSDTVEDEDGEQSTVTVTAPITYDPDSNSLQLTFQEVEYTLDRVMF